MNQGTAIELGKLKMQELGVEDYLIRFRHFQVTPNRSIEIEGENNLFILVDPISSASVKSKVGIYDVRNNAINEMIYMHRGTITVQNIYQKRYLQVKFIQFIPKHT